MAPSDFPPSAVRGVVGEVAGMLKEKKETISVVETAAGGIISASLLATPGASQFYKGGLTASTKAPPPKALSDIRPSSQLYTLESRIAFAGWTQDSIKAYRGPTPDIVAGLAEHVRSTLGSTYTVCESGTAGPTGGQTRNRQPGYCALAVSCDKGTFTREIDTGLGGGRQANMIRFAEEALRFVGEVVRGEAKL
ncbi:hypothetical protein B0A49_05987 [Cryomyces minteri]|uniref:CinA C-terminal domain-containing protein n=1 Tax=Cryomyces minteri TaxID=331657 RepID=A0A4V5NFS5_9PEZI|nr:hypothetical protein B0A49_05987 [Cryomyces minteri]